MHEDYIKRVNWEAVGTYLDAIAQRINPHDFTGVYGIPRGGSVLGAWLSHKLYLPLLSSPTPQCIIIDDICDSGRTLEQVVNSLGDPEGSACFVTVMFYSLVSNKYVDYYYKEKTDNWIVFPWEQ